MDTKKSLIAVLVILIFSVVGVLAWKSFSGPVSQPDLSPALLASGSIAEQDVRDAQRIKDINLLNEKIFASNTKLGGFAFAASEWQNISTEEHPLVLELKNNGFLDKPLKDPSPDKYYSYRSNRYTYELRAVLENKESGKCEVSGDLCFYTVKKEMTPAPAEDTSLEGSGYDGSYIE